MLQFNSTVWRLLVPWQCKMPLHDLEDVKPVLHDAPEWIAPDTQIIGKVRIGKGSRVWFGAVLHGDSDLIGLGAHGKTPDDAPLHTDPGFPLVIGEGAPLMEGKPFPPRSLILGSPVKLVKTLSPAEAKRLKARPGATSTTRSGIATISSKTHSGCAAQRE